MKNYNDVLEKMKSADMWDWFAESQSVSIFIDDIPADRRTVLRVNTQAGRNGRVHVVTLCGYNAKKNAWTENCNPCGSYDLENKNGLKALKEFVREHSLKTTGFPASRFVSFNKLVSDKTI